MKDQGEEVVQSLGVETDKGEERRLVKANKELKELVNKLEEELARQRERYESEIEVSFMGIIEGK